MNFDAYMVVYQKSSERVNNYNAAKDKYNQLLMFEAYDAINDGDKCIQIGKDENLLGHYYLKKDKVHGETGCALSHLKLIEHFYNTSDKDWLLVFEDDVYLNNFNPNIINKLINLCNDNSSYFVQMFTPLEILEKQKKTKQFAPNVYQMIITWGTVSYMIHKKGWEILKKALPINYPIDFLPRKFIKELNALAFINNIILNIGSRWGGDQDNLLGSIVNPGNIMLPLTNENMSKIINRELNNFDKINRIGNNFIFKKHISKPKQHLEVTKQQPIKLNKQKHRQLNIQQSKQSKPSKQQPKQQPTQVIKQKHRQMIKQSRQIIKQSRQIIKQQPKQIIKQLRQINKQRIGHLIKQNFRQLNNQKSRKLIKRNFGQLIKQKHRQLNKQKSRQLMKEKPRQLIKQKLEKLTK